MAKIFYHGVKVVGNDRRKEMFRYDTAEQAMEAARYQEIDNWRSVRSATYVGRRIHWPSLLAFWNS